MLLGTTVIFVHETIRIIKLCHVTWIVKSICGRKRFLSHVFTRMPMIMWECKYISEDLQLCHTLTSWTKANFKKTSHAPVCTWFKNESYGVIGEAANPQPHPFCCLCWSLKRMTVLGYGTKTSLLRINFIVLKEQLCWYKFYHLKGQCITLY